jgi:hypothetical protein
MTQDRGTSLKGNGTPLEPYGRNMPRALWWSYEGGAVSQERGNPVGASTQTASSPVPARGRELGAITGAHRS